MAHDDFAKVQELFGRARSLPPAQRDAMLDEACAGQPELRDAVQRLFDRADTIAPPPLSGRQREITQTVHAGAPQSHFHTGSLVGGYELGRYLGEGAMGQVWEARHKLNGMRVAIKLVFHETYGNRTLTEVAHEFHLLKEKRHDHIVRVHDAGVHKDGGESIPYVVMEYLPAAEPITVYADDRSLSVRQRVELFHSICEAVAYVHEAGQIHLDLKPGNMLVDATGRAYLTDFGIARPVLGWYVERVSGTKGFMSPEHMRGDIDLIDKRADVWSLGAVLFRLLAGDDPHGLDSRSSMRDRIAASRRPARKLTEADADIAIQAPELIAPLEHIVARCLAPEREKRYENAGAISTALRSALHPGGLREVAYSMRRDWPRSWLALVLSAIVACSTMAVWLATPLIDLLAPTMSWFAAMLPAPCNSLANATELPNVTILAFDSETANVLAGKYLPDFKPTTSRKSFRPMHAAAIRKLVDARVRVIALDLSFTQKGEVAAHDTELAAAILSAREAGIPVVVGARMWRLDRGRPEITEEIRKAEPGWGGLEVHHFEGGVNRRGVMLLVERPDEDPLPSFALATLAAYESPGNRHQYSRERSMIRIRHYILADERRHYVAGREATVEAHVAPYESIAASETGLQPGDMQSLLVLETPSPEAIQGAVIPYQDIWTKDGQVGERVRGRVALIADVEDPEHLVQAAGIQSLILGFGTVSDTLWSFFLVPLGAAVCGLISWQVRRRSRGRPARRSRIVCATYAALAGIVSAGILLLSIAWIARYVSGIWVNVLPGIVSSVFAAMLVLCLMRVPSLKQGAQEVR